MRDDLNRQFWFDLRKQGANPSSISDFESRTGFQLPTALKALLLVRDGGVSKFSVFRRGEIEVPIPSFFSLEEMRISEASRQSLGEPREFVAIAGGGHDLLMLDYRGRDDPAVVYREDDDSPLEVLEESFPLFLSHLVE